MPRSISLIRHGEKQIGGVLPQGVSVDGAPDPYSMTPRGWQRAGALIALFVGRPDATVPALLPTPTHLFASEVGPHSQSRRPEETLMPIAARLGMTITESFLQDQLDELAGALEPSSEVLHVLQVGRKLLRRPLVHRHVVDRCRRAPVVLEQQVLGHHVLLSAVHGPLWPCSLRGRSRARVLDIPRPSPPARLVSARQCQET